jgi:hypothetical protein
VEELFSDIKEYKSEDMAEQRKYKEDCKKIYDQAREAYALEMSIQRRFASGDLHQESRSVGTT